MEHSCGIATPIFEGEKLARYATPMSGVTVTLVEAGEFLGFPKKNAEEHILRLFDSNTLDRATIVTGKVRPVVHEMYDTLPIPERELDREFAVFGPARISSCSLGQGVCEILTVRANEHLKCPEFPELWSRLALIDECALEIVRPLEIPYQDLLVFMDDLRILKGTRAEEVRTESIHAKRYEEAVLAAQALRVGGLKKKEITWAALFEYVRANNSDYPLLTNTDSDQDSLRKSISKVGNPVQDGRVP